MIKRTVRGVGYNGEGDHQRYVDKVAQPAYRVWAGMMDRCYNTQYRKSHLSYEGCTIAEEWHDFQVFAEWFYNHKYSNKGYHIDKDLLVKGNRVYSPETCCFAPKEINIALVEKVNVKDNHPRGVRVTKTDSGENRFVVGLGFYGHQKHLGVFATADEAFEVYREAKERHVKNMALKWANKIELRLYFALMNWTV